jgi:hypothetical protein
MMEAELADLRAKGKQLIRVIKKLKQEQEEAAAESGSSAEPGSEESRTLPRVGGTCCVLLFDDADGIESEESRTLSHGRVMSVTSDGVDTSKYSHCRGLGSTI